MSRRLKSERQTLSCPLHTTTQTMRFRQAAIESSSKNGGTKNHTLPRRPTACLPPDRSSAASLPRCMVSVSAALKPLRGTAPAHPPVFCALRRKESLMPSRVSQPTAVRNSPTEFTDRPNNSEANRSARFEKTLSEPGFLHKRIRPYRPGTTAGGNAAAAETARAFARLTGSVPSQASLLGAHLGGADATTFPMRPLRRCSP